MASRAYTSCSIDLRPKLRDKFAFAFWGLLTLLSSGVSPLSASEGVVLVEIDAGTQGTPANARIVIIDASSHGGEERYVAVPDGQGPTSVPLHQGIYRLRADIDGFWSEERVVAINRASAVLAINVRPWIAVRGTFRASRGAHAPAGLDLRVEPALVLPAQAPAIAMGERFQCAIDAKSRFECLVPAGIQSYSLRATGFAPVYVWETLRGGAELGTVVFTPGSSVAAQIAVPIAMSRVTGKLIPLTADVGNAPSRAITAKPNELGFLQLKGVLPGMYRLELRAPGLARFAQTLKVIQDRESRLHRVIVLREPVRLEVGVTPELDTNGKLWSMKLRPVAAFGAESSPVRTTTFSGSGRALFTALDPGKYVLTLLDSDGSRVHSRDVVLDDDLQISIDVDSVPISGKVERRGKGTPATIWFGGRQGAESVKVATNPQGTFEGNLPRDGRWSIEVLTKENIEIAFGLQPVGQNMVLEIPTDEIEGVARFEDGRPARGVRVTLMSNGGSVTRSAGEDGSFRFEGVNPRLIYSVSAHDLRTGMRSERVQAKAVNGQFSPLVLQLLANQDLQFLVHSQGVPVPGAAVLVSSVLHSTVQQKRGITDEMGSVRLDSLQEATEIVVSVAAPGRVLQAFRFDSPMEKRIALGLSEHAGTLHLILSKKVRDLVVFQNGVPLNFQEMYRWSHGHGVAWNDGEITIPLLAAGEYAICYESGEGRDCQNSRVIPNERAVLNIAAH